MTTLVACDTSLLVAALSSWHPDHQTARVSLHKVTGVPAHVLLECYSVLTRLPHPHRVKPADAAAALAALPWPTLDLPDDRTSSFLTQLAANNIVGGAAYDGLVAASALHHGHRLASLDRRAHRTYLALGVELSSSGLVSNGAPSPSGAVPSSMPGVITVPSARRPSWQMMTSASD